MSSFDHSISFADIQEIPIKVIQEDIKKWFKKGDKLIEVC